MPKRSSAQWTHVCKFARLSEDVSSMPRLFLSALGVFTPTFWKRQPWVYILGLC